MGVQFRRRLRVSREVRRRAKTEMPVPEPRNRVGFGLKAAGFCNEQEKDWRDYSVSPAKKSGS